MGPIGLVSGLPVMLEAGGNKAGTPLRLVRMSNCAIQTATVILGAGDMTHADFEAVRRLPTSETSSDKVKAVKLVEQLVEAAATRDLDRLAKLYSSSAVAISPVFGEVTGRDAIMRTWEMLFSTLKDIRVHISDLLVDEPRIAIVGEISAVTDRAGWFGFPARGVNVAYRMLLLLTFTEGQIVRDERIYDIANVVKGLEKARIDEELKTAAEVQRALLPRKSYAGTFCRAVGASAPSRAVGGDFFELVDLPSGDVGLAIADVSGKGPSAALLAALIQGMLLAEAVREGGPAAVVSRINALLAVRRIESRFATLMYCVVSPDGRLAYCNAGHNPPILLSSREVVRLDVGGVDSGRFSGRHIQSR